MSHHTKYTSLDEKLELLWKSIHKQQVIARVARSQHKSPYFRDADVVEIELDNGVTLTLTGRGWTLLHPDKNQVDKNDKPADLVPKVYGRP